MTPRPRGPHPGPTPRSRGVDVTAVGLMLAPQGDPAEVVGAARRAEELGYDFLACGEHVFFHSPTPNAFVALAAAAGATTRIRLLSALTILPLYPAALAAKMAATLDRVSGGRFDLGIGVGGEFPAEFAACDVPVPRRGRRTDEALDLLTRLFAGERVAFDGHEVTLDPLPVQRPRPPLWIGGRSEAAMRRAGRFGDIWVPYLCSPTSSRADSRRWARPPPNTADPASAGRRSAGREPDATARPPAAARSRRSGGSTGRTSPRSPTGTSPPEPPSRSSPACGSTSTRAPARSCSCPPARTTTAAMVDLFAHEIAPALRSPA